MVGARVRRPQVAYARARGLSGRRACALLSVARSTLGYQSRLVDRDAPALAVVLSILLQLIRTKAEPELLLEPTADGLGYGPLGIGPLDTQMVRIDQHRPVSFE